MANTFTDQNFQDEVLNEKIKLVIVDFYADWCGPCQMLGPIIEELAQEYGDKVKVGKLNVDDNNEIASNYSVTSIPLILFFKNGEMVEKKLGFQSKDALEEAIEEHI